MKRTEIYSNGEYLKNNPTWDAPDAVWKVKHIHELLVRNNIHFGEVTDVGCGAGKILEGLCTLYPEVKKWKGYDISPQAIEMARQTQRLPISFLNEDFLSTEYIYTDLLLCIDVVEHVPDYYGFLDKLKTKSGYFVFHIPLDLACRSLMKPHILLQQREAVGHIHYFSSEMVRWMLKDTGYKIIDWQYTKPMIDVMPQTSAKEKIKKALRKVSFSINENTSVKLWGGYSMMILAKQETDEKNTLVAKLVS